MTKPGSPNLLLMKRVLRQLQPAHDQLREALMLGQSHREGLPYKNVEKIFRSFSRDPMLAAFWEIFQETGLGGFPLLESRFPQSLRFGDDEVVLIFRRPEGFRNHPDKSTQDQLELIPGQTRIVVFWSYPISGKDALARLSLQMFKNDVPLEGAEALSEKIPVLTDADKITEAMFNPEHPENPQLDFGS